MYRRVIQKIKVGFTLRGPPCISYFTKETALYLKFCGSR